MNYRLCMSTVIFKLNIMSRLLCSVEGGELFDRVVTSGRLSEATAKLMFYQIVLGVKVLS